MKIHTKQNKPHRKHMSIAQVIIVLLSLIKSGVTIVLHKDEFESIREDFKSTNWM